MKELACPTLEESREKLLYHSAAMRELADAVVTNLSKEEYNHHLKMYNSYARLLGEPELSL